MIHLTIDDKNIEVSEGTSVLRADQKASVTIPTRNPSGPFGAKAAAEIPTDGVAPALVNAIYDAAGVAPAPDPGHAGARLARLERKSLMSGVTCCDFNDFVKAMADETRQRILSLLQAGEMNESDIVAHLELTQPTISHHLSLLRRANLVTARREGKYVFYRANPACVTECCGEILNRFKISAEKIDLRVLNREGDQDD